MMTTLRNLMIGEDFKFINGDKLFCYVGVNGDDEAIIVSLDYIGPNAQGNGVFSENRDSKVTYVPRHKHNK